MVAVDAPEFHVVNVDGRRRAREREPTGVMRESACERSIRFQYLSRVKATFMHVKAETGMTDL